MRPRLIPTFILIGLIVVACNTPGSGPTPTPSSTPPTVIPTPIPPPVQGPAVVGDKVEIEDWEYLGPESIESLPPLSDTVREVGPDDVFEARLAWRPDGFDLVWIAFPCAKEPVVVVHADATIEFWPADRIWPTCEAMAVVHMLTAQWQTSIPFEDWKFIYHPPRLPDP